MLVAFGVCIVYPYYIQGYREIQEPVPGPALGITRLSFINDFAYLYSSIPLGFVWLASGLSFLILGDICANSNVEKSLKILFALLYSFCILNLHSFGTIGIVLD
jgi:hypothetical protein